MFDGRLVRQILKVGSNQVSLSVYRHVLPSTLNHEKLQVFEIISLLDRFRFSFHLSC